MKDNENRLWKFLTENLIEYEECLLCKSQKQNSNDVLISSYYSIVKHKGASGPIYVINDRFWYDYAFLWEENNEPWEIIFKTK